MQSSLEGARHVGARVRSPFRGLEAIKNLMPAGNDSPKNPRFPPRRVSIAPDPYLENTEPPFPSERKEGLLPSAAAGHVHYGFGASFLSPGSAALSPLSPASPSAPSFASASAAFCLRSASAALRCASDCLLKSMI